MHTNNLKISTKGAAAASTTSAASPSVSSETPTSVEISDIGGVDLEEGSSDRRAKFKRTKCMRDLGTDTSSSESIDRWLGTVESLRRFTYNTNSMDLERGDSHGPRDLYMYSSTQQQWLGRNNGTTPVTISNPQNNICEVQVLKWHTTEGEFVSEGQILATVIVGSTGKISCAPSPADGILLAVTIEEGKMNDVDSPIIAYLITPGVDTIRALKDSSLSTLAERNRSNNVSLPYEIISQTSSHSHSNDRRSSLDIKSEDKHYSIIG